MLQFVAPEEDTAAFAIFLSFSHV